MSKAQELHNERLAHNNLLAEKIAKYEKAVEDSGNQRVEGQQIHKEAEQLRINNESWEEMGNHVTDKEKQEQRDMAMEAIKLLDRSGENEQLAESLNREIYAIQTEALTWKPSTTVNTADIKASLESIGETEESIDLINAKIAEIGSVDRSGYIPKLEALHVERGELATAVVLGERGQKDLDELDYKIKEVSELVSGDKRMQAEQDGLLKGLNLRLDTENEVLRGKQEAHKSLVFALKVDMAEKKGSEFAALAKKFSQMECDLRAINESIGRPVTGALTYPAYRLEALKGVNLFGDMAAARKKVADICDQMSA